MDMSGRQPPQTGSALIDNLVALAYALIFGVNFWVSTSALADIGVAIGGFGTFIISLLRAYEHVAGETVFETLYETQQET